jgi:sensor histidine kinase YesM
MENKIHNLCNTLKTNAALIMHKDEEKNKKLQLKLSKLCLPIRLQRKMCLQNL